MKKLFTFAMALMAAMAINATDYYFAGAANGWSNNNDAWKFTDVNGVLTLEVADLYGEFKIAENGAWHPQHGAAAQGEGVALNGSYNLVKCDDSQGEADAPANANILFPQEGDWRYKDAKLTLDASNPDALVISLVAGTLYDHSAAPKTYQIVGAFNGWNAGEAPSFEEVNGVLTVTLADISGTFKIIQDHAWDNQWATNWETKAGLVVNEPYELGAKGDNGEPSNLAFANPFAGYRDAVFTLAIGEGGKMTLTLVSGTFYAVQNDWYIAGAWQEWKLPDEAAKMTPVEGQANTYELLLAEFSGEFKVVYGEWAVEFGAAKGSGEQWNVNTPIELSFPCDNMKPEDPDAVYEDVTITLVVDYENVAATLTIATEDGSAVDNVTLNAKSIKRIENGQLLIENNGVRFNAAGIAQ
ncbi:MAG: hypothetical protein IJQ97_07020 [Paludibacteraceae bacterium]|nr:hypothetical protein [Paludibacteraceae bacterium]